MFQRLWAAVAVLTLVAVPALSQQRPASMTLDSTLLAAFRWRAVGPANYVGRIAPRPLLMMNGTLDDDYSRERSVEPLYRLARQPKTILWAETGHQVPSPEQLSATVQFLRAHLE